MAIGGQDGTLAKTHALGMPLFRMLRDWSERHGWVGEFLEEGDSFSYCGYCHEGIEPGKPTALFPWAVASWGQVVVHEECTDLYRGLFGSREAAGDGDILAVCAMCAWPIRETHLYRVERRPPGGYSASSLPIELDDLFLTHERCRKILELADASILPEVEKAFDGFAGVKPGPQVLATKGG